MLFGTSTVRLGLFPAHGRWANGVPTWARRHYLALHPCSVDLQPTAVAAHSCYSAYSATLNLTRTLMFTRKIAAPLSIAIASYTTASVFGQGVVYCIDERIFGRQQEPPQTAEPFVIYAPNASTMRWMPPRPRRPPRPSFQASPHDESEFDLRKIVMSGGLGFGMGYVLKKVSNLVLLVGALGYGCIALLRVKGFDVNFEQYWPQIEPAYTRALDLDGDGRVTEGDLHQVAKNVIDLFNRYLQRDASFTVGFLAGLYCA